MPRPEPLTVQATSYIFANMEAGQDTIPTDVYRDLLAHVTEGTKAGHFVEHCLTNNFVNAACAADLANHRKLGDIARFINCRLPEEAWGSVAKVRAWRDARRRDPLRKPIRGCLMEGVPA